MHTVCLCNVFNTKPNNRDGINHGIVQHLMHVVWALRARGRGSRSRGTDLEPSSFAQKNRKLNK